MVDHVKQCTLGTDCMLFLEKSPESKTFVTENTNKFQTNCYRIDAYANVVNWLDSTSALPLFPKPIKVKGQTDFPIEVRIILFVLTTAVVT